MFMAFVVVVIAISIYQEHKTERALAALRDLSSPRALVVRDGAQLRIAGRDVVRGDLLLLAEGDRVPADAVVVDCANFSVDESALTGESVPVRKVAIEPSALSAAMGRPAGTRRRGCSRARSLSRGTPSPSRKRPAPAPSSVRSALPCGPSSRSAPRFSAKSTAWSGFWRSSGWPPRLSW